MSRLYARRRHGGNGDIDASRFKVETLGRQSRELRFQLAGNLDEKSQLAAVMKLSEIEPQLQAEQLRLDKLESEERMKQFRASAAAREQKQRAADPYKRFRDFEAKMADAIQKREAYLAALRELAILEQAPDWPTVEAPAGSDFQTGFAFRLSKNMMDSTSDYFRENFGIPPGGVEGYSGEVARQMLAKHALSRAKYPDKLRADFPRYFAFEQNVAPPGGPAAAIFSIGGANMLNPRSHHWHPRPCFLYHPHRHQ